MIEVKNLTKTYQLESGIFKAVDNISFSVNRGEIYAIIGLSGAGKSTLVRMINRLIEPTSGDIYIDKKNIVNLNSRDLQKIRKKMSMVFQSFNLFYQMTVLENVALPLKIAGVNKKTAHKKSHDLLNFVGLSDRENFYPKSLSGGQKQRVAIARALSNDPKIILSDEATSALDPESTRDICTLYKKVVKEFNTSIIMITHQMDVAKNISDRIMLMDSGKKIEENSTIELFKNPQSKLAKSFIRDTIPEVKIDYSTFEGLVKRVSYTNETVNTPVLSNAIKNYDIDINIIEGNINNVKNSQLGYMIVEFKGEKNEIQEAINYMEKSGAKISEVNNDY